MTEETKSKKLRVYKLASEINISAEQLVEFLQKKGHVVKSIQSILTDDMITEINNHFKKDIEKAEKHYKKIADFNKKRVEKVEEDEKKAAHKHEEHEPEPVPSTWKLLLRNLNRLLLMKSSLKIPEVNSEEIQQTDEAGNRYRKKEKPEETPLLKPLSDQNSEPTELKEELTRRNRTGCRKNRQLKSLLLLRMQKLLKEKVLQLLVKWILVNQKFSKDTLKEEPLPALFHLF